MDTAHTLKVDIKSIPHNEQRYETVGDWEEMPDWTWRIRVSEMKDWRYNLLVGIHELVEMALCKQRGISEPSITAFDMEFESNRDPGDETEPGDSPEAPYQREHFFATSIERLIAAELDVDWQTYDDAVMSVE